MESPSVELLPLSAEAMERYARLRATERVAHADAIHLACAGTRGVDLFLTHDAGLRRLAVPGISFIAGIDGKLFP